MRRLLRSRPSAAHGQARSLLLKIRTHPTGPPARSACDRARALTPVRRKAAAAAERCTAATLDVPAGATHAACSEPSAAASPALQAPLPAVRAQNVDAPKPQLAHYCARDGRSAARHGARESFARSAPRAGFARSRRGRGTAWSRARSVALGRVVAVRGDSAAAPVGGAWRGVAAVDDGAQYDRGVTPARPPPFASLAGGCWTPRQLVRARSCV